VAGEAVRRRRKGAFGTALLVYNTSGLQRHISQFPNPQRFVPLPPRTPWLVHAENASRPLFGKDD